MAVQLRALVAMALLCGACGVATVTSCAPPPRMCAFETDCGAQASCVAGRCVAHGATAAIATARRLLIAPVDVGWVRRGDPAAGGVATLGRGDGATIFLRFAVPLPAEVGVVEGYLLLQRAPATDPDPGTLVLHAARIEGAWEGRTLSWGRQPHVVDLGAPVTTVQAAGGASFLRLDVRAIVERWRRRDRAEGGIAVVTEGETATGLPLALTTLDIPSDREDPVLAPPPGPATQPPSFEPPPALPPLAGNPQRQVAGPRLELYVR